MYKEWIYSSFFLFNLIDLLLYNCCYYVNSCVSFMLWDVDVFKWVKEIGIIKFFDEE